jgi:hypothetical protein
LYSRPDEKEEIGKKRDFMFANLRIFVNSEIPSQPIKNLISNFSGPHDPSGNESKNIYKLVVDIIKKIIVTLEALSIKFSPPPN